MFDDGVAYERFMGRWSSAVADDFLAAIAPPTGAAWLDVGCGSGALLAAARAWSPSQLIGIDPSAAQLEQARQRLGGDVELHVAGAQALPLPTGSVDVCVTALALNFGPDPAAGLREMARVTRHDGIAAGYVWDYTHPAFFLSAYWEAAADVAPSVDERGRWEICSLDGMRTLLEGHAGAHVWPIEVATTFASADELWSGFELGIGPTGAHLARLDSRSALALRARFEDVVAGLGGPAGLTARAIAFRFDPG